MKKVWSILLVVMFLGVISGPAFASGGKNHGDKGQGSVNTGSTAKGQGSQSRTGR